MSQQQELEGSSKKSLSKRIKNFVRRYFDKEIGEEIHNILEERAESEGVLSEEEKELIVSALKFRDVVASDVSVPRRDVIYVNMSDDFQKALTAFKESGYSRLPVCGEDGLDEVLGFITLKDMVRFIGNEKGFRIKDILRHATFVPESLPIPSVLTLMRQNRVQMVVVVDEYGGTAGLISLKDILGELVGDLEDEHAEVSSTLVVPLSGGRYQINARTPIEELDDTFKEKLMVEEGDDYDTVGGYLLHLAGKVPNRGEKFELENGNKLLVLDADGRRINLIAFIPARNNPKQAKNNLEKT